MSVGPLPVSDIVVVNVSVAAPPVNAKSFNQGLIVGPSTVIPSYGTNPRLRQYATLNAMLSDGFTVTEPEYLAAELYFSAESVPQFVWIGRQDLTAIETAYPTGRRVADGVMSSSSNPTHLSSATASFVAGDVGSAVRVVGAGAAGADLTGIIETITSGSIVVLSATCLTTVSAAAVTIASALPRTVTDAAMSSSSNPTHLSSATASFVSGDVGAVVVVPGAGAAGVPLLGTILSISSGTVAVLSATCLTTVSSQTVNIGAVHGYAVSDQITVTQASASNGVLTVLELVLGIPVEVGTTTGNQGTGYSDASALATTGGTGVGLEIDITAVGETYLQAVQACALVNQNWYGFMCCNASDSDHLALAAYSTANWETLLYLGSTSTVAVVNGTAGNVALQMQAASYRALLSYNTTQSGAYPNNVYAAAAILGEYCGLNTGLAGSAFTLDLKQLAGIAPEPLTQTQFNTLQSENCNTCVSFGAYIGYFSNGILSSGLYFDQVLFRAMLVNQIQTNLMNLLISVPKVPQTNPGEHQLIAQVDASCANMASIGYLGGGVWNGAQVLNLQPGTALPLGYLNQAQSYQFQSSGNRAARQAMPIYCCIIEAGAVQSVQVNVNVQL